MCDASTSRTICGVAAIAGMPRKQVGNGPLSVQLEGTAADNCAKDDGRR
jgi:hypothetical protein